jgi:hypothetical protein
MFLKFQEKSQVHIVYITDIDKKCRVEKIQFILFFKQVKPLFLAGFLTSTNFALIIKKMSFYRV